MIAVLIEQQVRETLNWPFAAALSAVLLAFDASPSMRSPSASRAREEPRHEPRACSPVAACAADLLLPDAAAAGGVPDLAQLGALHAVPAAGLFLASGTSATSTIRNGSMPPGARSISARRPRCWLWRWACRWPSAWCAASSPAARWSTAWPWRRIIVPTIILSVAVYGLFAKLKLIGEWYGLVVAHTVLALPFVVLVMTGGPARFRPRAGTGGGGAGRQPPRRRCSASPCRCCGRAWSRPAFWPSSPRSTRWWWRCSWPAPT